MSGASGSWITETISEVPDMPLGVKIGDFLVSRYTHSTWNEHLPWEDWDLAVIVVSLDPLTVVEATGIGLGDTNKGTKSENIEKVVQYEFSKQRKIKKHDGSQSNGNLYLDPTLIEILWCTPKFPTEIKQRGSWKVRKKNWKVITQSEARKLIVNYALAQLGKQYNILTHKWNEKYFYCSKLVYKSYSMTIKMYLETTPAGYHVTPEDLMKSKSSRIYHRWLNEKFIEKKT